MPLVFYYQKILYCNYENAKAAVSCRLAHKE